MIPQKKEQHNILLTVQNVKPNINTSISNLTHNSYNGKAQIKDTRL